jgi:hypothetical protein
MIVNKLFAWGPSRLTATTLAQAYVNMKQSDPETAEKFRVFMMTPVDFSLLPSSLTDFQTIVESEICRIEANAE